MGMIAFYAGLCIGILLGLLLSSLSVFECGRNHCRGLVAPERFWAYWRTLHYTGGEVTSGPEDAPQ